MNHYKPLYATQQTMAALHIILLTLPTTQALPRYLEQLPDVVQETSLLILIPYNTGKNKEQYKWHF